MANKLTQIYNYRFYGHSFCSNVPLPGAIPVEPNVDPNEITLHLGWPTEPIPDSITSADEVIYTSSEMDVAGEPVLRILKLAASAFINVVYSDGMEFWIDRTRKNVWGTWPATSSLESTLSTLLGPIIGLLLRLRGVTCLHASSVSFGDFAVAFLGATGSGKSTTAAAFAREGCAIFSDDITALAEVNGAFQVMPGYPRVCLWPQSVEMLFGTADALPKIVPDDEKRFFALGGKDAPLETRSLPLGVIYVLGERRPGSAPYIEPLHGQPALISLVADTFANNVLDRTVRAHEFNVLSRLVEKVPIRRVFPLQDPARITELCRMIRSDFTDTKKTS